MEPSNQQVPWGSKRVPDSRQTPAKTVRGQQSSPSQTSSPSASFPKAQAVAVHHQPHSFRQGPTRGTRSAAIQEFASAFEWEALDLEKAKGSGATPAKGKKTQPSSSKMSRNRPRGPPMPRDNGQAANEETDMWNKILQDLRKAKEKNDKQKAIGEQIHALNEKIGRDGGSK